MALDLEARRHRDLSVALGSLRRVVRALRVAAGRTEEATGLSAAQLFVLQAVSAEPGCSLSEVASRTLTDRTSVAAVVGRLVERGLLERQRASNDRRRVELFPTVAAVTLLGHAPHAPTRRVLDGMGAMSDRDVHHLALGLARLVRAMGLSDEPAGMFFEELPRPARRGVGGALDGAPAGVGPEYAGPEGAELGLGEPGLAEHGHGGNGHGGNGHAGNGLARQRIGVDGLPAH